MNGSNICVYESDFMRCVLISWKYVCYCIGSLENCRKFFASFSCFRLLEDGATYVCKLGLHCDQDCYAKLKLQ